MKNKRNQIFFLIVFAVVGFTMWDLRSAKLQDQKEEAEAKLLTFPVDQIDAFTITKGSTTTHMTRSAEGWSVASPIQDQADNSQVENFLQKVSDEKSTSVVAEGEIDWAQYGLKNPAGQLKFSHQNKSQSVIEVGTVMSHEGKTYVRRDGAFQVLLANADWNHWLDHRAIDFRDRRWLRGRLGAVEELKVKNLVNEFHLVRKDNNWTETAHPNQVLDQKRVHEIITQLAEVKAMNILAEKDLGPTMKSLKLKTPVLKLSAKMGDRLWHSEVYEGSDVIATVSDPVFLLQLEPLALNRLKSLTWTSLKDKTPLFDFDPTLVKKITLETPLKKQSFTEKESHWILDGSSASLVKEQELAELPSKIKNLQVPDFTDTDPVPKTHHVKLLAADNKVLFQLDWRERDAKVLVAKSSLSPDSFYLDQKEIEKLRLHQLVEPVPGDPHQAKEKN